jgi:hypothetical protein
VSRKCHGHFLEFSGFACAFGAASKPCGETLATQGLSPPPRLSLAANKASGGYGPRTLKDFFNSLQWLSLCESRLYIN